MKQINFLASSVASIILLTLCSCRETEESFPATSENRTLKKEVKRDATVTKKDSTIIIQSTENDGEPIKPIKM